MKVQTSSYITLLTVLSLSCFQSLRAQDTTRSKTVNVVSSYKPVLRNAVKINFNATLPPVDTKTQTLQYNVPAQSLFVAYLQNGFKPLALQTDSNGIKENSNYVKAGFGNFSTPYAEAGFSFGDGKKSALNIYANHISSKGNIEFQKYSQTGIEADGRAIAGPVEVYGKVGFQQNNYNQYGYNHTIDTFSSKQVEKNYQTFRAQIGLKNATSNDYGFSYDPHVNFSIFRDSKSAHELNVLIAMPMRKQLSDNLAFRVSVAADLTSYKTDSIGKSVSNNIVYVNPGVVYTSDVFTLDAAINPSWDKSKFALYPDIALTVKIGQPFAVIAGWTGQYRKNNYQYLAGVNPFMDQPTTQYNTELRNLYGGIKGSAGSHVTYLAKLGLLTYNHLPLFVNDSMSGKGFYTVEEGKLQNLQFHGELGFIAPNSFNLTVAADVNNYFSQRTNKEPWHMPGFELTSKLRWEPIKDLTLKADLFTWSGAKYLTAAKATDKLGSAFDLNAGIEFKVSKAVGLWLQCNNILNNTYQRWNQYDVLGFNILGGVVFSFGQSR